MRGLYWGLRKYAGNQDLVWGGDNHHEHLWSEVNCPTKVGTQGMTETVKYAAVVEGSKPSPSNFCSLCGAWRGALGLEPTPELYVQHIVEICCEIKRVLRPDGVFWLNIGDSYAGGKGQSGQPVSAADQEARAIAGTSINRGHDQMEMSIRPSDSMAALRSCNLKPKDLCLIPERLALALQADGWWVRSRIAWVKPNPMPESVRDRPTDSWEHIWMLTKSAHYFFDNEAVREVAINEGRLVKATGANAKNADSINATMRGFTVHDTLISGRNLRSVWTFSTQPYKGAHFATFPEELPKRCIKASTKEGDTVLDPFCGSGTTLWVAKKLGRRSVGYELSTEYCELAMKRNQQGGLL